MAGFERSPRKIAALCREFGISRTTGHKWSKRYEADGYAGLEEQSRKPKTAPLATGEEIVMAVLESRQKRPRWGPRKLHKLLQKRFGEQTPSARTIARILKRADLVRVRRSQRRPSVVDRAPQVQAQRCNEVWTVDFKGWWRSRDGMRCEPLTVRDAFSRFVICVQLAPTTTRAVREIFERLFARYGVPDAIQCDNGPPFVSVRARGGISKLSAWWLSLGIALVRSRPGCPQDNGGHERMHSDIAADVQSRPAANADAQQHELERWRQDFNAVRPHEALGGKTPSEMYKPTERRKVVMRPFEYPAHMSVVRVHKTGTFAWCGNAYFLGGPFSASDVGIEHVDALHLRVWFRDIDLGVVDIVPPVSSSTYEQIERIMKSKKSSNAA